MRPPKTKMYPLPVPWGSLDKRILSLRMCRGNSAQSFLLYGHFPHLQAASLLDTLSDWVFKSPVWILFQQEVPHFSVVFICSMFLIVGVFVIHTVQSESTQTPFTFLHILFYFILFKDSKLSLAGTCGVCMFSLYLCGFSPGMQVRLSCDSKLPS